MENTFDRLTEALWEYGEAVRDLYQKRLLSDGKKASGNLINNIQTLVAYKGTEFVVYLELEDYWRWVEDGRKPGKFPPEEAILSWIKAKPVLPTPDSNGKLPTEKQLSFLIRRKIAREGTPAGHQLKETIESINSKYIPILQEALQQDFDTYVMKTFKDVGRMIKI